MSNYTSELNDILNSSEHTDAENINNYFTFDRRSRKITIPASFVTLGVESDDSSERVWFEGPRIVGDNIDLTTRNIYINYQNANGEKDSWYVEDIVAEDDIVHFSWKIERKVVAYKGNVTFLICALTTDAEGKVETEWHTSRCTALVLEGLEVENPAPPAEEYDLINQLIDVTKKSIKDVTDTCSQTIETLGAKEQEAINNIAEKETNSIDAVEKAKNDAVGYIGSGLDKTLAKQGIAAESQAVGDAILKAKIVDRASGELISLSDSAEQPLQSMKIFGKTKQFTTTGKNKLPYPYYDSSITKNGITFTVNGDGSITLNGTATAEANFFFATKGNFLEAGKTYCIVTKMPNVKTVMAYKDENGQTKYVGDNMATSVVWSENYTLSNIYISVPNGTTANNTVYPIIVEGDSYDGIWEPYTGGIPSPNPDYPQELVSVGDSGSTTEYVMGGNLLPYPYTDTTKTVSGITFTDNGDGSITINGTATEGTYSSFIFCKKNIRLVDGETYYMPKIRNAFFYCAYSNENGKTCYGESEIVWSSKYKLIQLYLQISGGTTISNITFYPIVARKNSYDGIWEPYKKEQSLTIPTPNGLPGIGDELGNCDYIDFKNGVKKIGEYVFDGVSEFDGTHGSWNVAGDGSTITLITWGRNETTFVYDVIPAAIDTPYLCTHFGTSEELTTKIIMDTSDDARSLYIDFIFSKNVTLDEFQTFLQEQYIAGTPVKLRYVLETPIETPLSEEEIQAYKALHTNYPNTTIYNDEGVYTEVEYVADTKLYVDNKIDKAIKNILEVVSNDG